MRILIKIIILKSIVLIAKLLSPRDKKHHCLVKIDGIGDFYTALNKIKVLVGENPESVLIVSDHVAPFARIELPDVIIMKVDRSSFFKYVKSILKICMKYKFAVLHNLHLHRRTLLDDLLACSIRSTRKIAFKGGELNSSALELWISSQYYDKLEPVLYDQIKYNYDGTVDNFKTNREKFAHHILIHTSAGEPYREWPTDNFLELIRRLQDMYDCSISVICSPRDKTKYLDVCNRNSVYCALPATSLLDQIVCADLIICNETSVSQIALHHNKACITLLGGGHFDCFIGPSIDCDYVHSVDTSCFGCNWKCVHQKLEHSAAPCVEAIKIENVLKRIECYVRR